MILVFTTIRRRTVTQVHTENIDYYLESDINHVRYKVKLGKNIKLIKYLTFYLQRRIGCVR